MVTQRAVSVPTPPVSSSRVTQACCAHSARSYLWQCCVRWSFPGSGPSAHNILHLHLWFMRDTLKDCTLITSTKRRWYWLSLPGVASLSTAATFALFCPSALPCTYVRYALISSNFKLSSQSRVFTCPNRMLCASNRTRETELQSR